MQLQEFVFDIKHRAGTTNGNANALSRFPSNVVTYCTTTVFTNKSILDAHIHDPHISKLFEIKPFALAKPPFFVWIGDEYFFHYNFPRVRNATNIIAFYQRI